MDNQPQFTPGKWLTGNANVQGVFSENGFIIADCSNTRTKNECEANARLIAASPIMYEALLAQEEANELYRQYDQTGGEPEKWEKFSVAEDKAIALRKAVLAEIRKAE
ncbi:MAG: hypothetical protein EPO08_20815 [Rhodospirillaceae bacterium]|nr:MAG: hypothetical protein EPO08_20815 [Rhodospirillaceae bacterium]